MTLDAAPQSSPKPRILLSAALLAAYAMAVAWVVDFGKPAVEK